MEMVIAEFPQVAIVDMEYLWTKCIPNAVDRDQVENKFTWGDKIMHGKIYYNSATSSNVIFSPG